jgi:hypothetical protein
MNSDTPESTPAAERGPEQAELREAARRTYLIDDFEAWDDAIHHAVVDFEDAFGCYPAHATVHPEGLARFGTRADPRRLRDADGKGPEPEDLEAAPFLAEFETDRYRLRFHEDPHLWPVQLVLWVAPPGAPMPRADTPPPPSLAGVGTGFEYPLVVRPAHAQLLVLADQCLGCRHLVTIRTCCAFPEGIPLPIAASRHDHREPFPGDGGLRHAPSQDPRLLGRATLKLVLGLPEDPVAPQDAPPDAPPPGPATPIGDQTLAPPLGTQAEARAEARRRLGQLLRELGGPHACSAQALTDRLRARYPVTYGRLRRLERGGPDATQRYVARWLGAQRRPRRDGASG